MQPSPDCAGSSNTAPAPSPKMIQTARSVKSVIDEFTSDPITSTFLYFPDSTNFVPIFKAYKNPEHPAEMSNPQVSFMPNLSCTRQAVDGYIMSGVTVPTTIKSMDCRSKGCRAWSFLTASTARSLAATPLSAMCRSRMPTRSIIQSFVVSTIFSKSALLSTRGGTYPATPVIFALTQSAMILLEEFRPRNQTKIVCDALCQRQAPAVHQGSGSWRLDFVLPGDLGGFVEHGGNRAVFVPGQLQRALHGDFVQRAAQLEHHIDFRPHARRVRGTLSGAFHHQGFELLTLFLEDAHHITCGASAQREQKHFHRIGRLVRLAVRIHGHGVARRAAAEKLLFADPSCGSCLHACSPQRRRVPL